MELGIALLAFAGGLIGSLITGPIQAMVAADRRDAADRRERRWRLEFDSLVELRGVLTDLSKQSDPRGDCRDLEALKVRAVGLAFSVRDDRPRRAVEPLVAMPYGDGFRDQLGNAVRVVGETLQEI